MANAEITNLRQLLDRIEDAAEDSERIRLGEILDIVGRRSFGPLLLLAGVATLAPLIGDIPGVPTIIATIILLLAVQLLFGRDRFWLPRWLLERSVASDKLAKAIGWLRRPAGFIDRLLRPRITVLTEGPAVRVIAVVCILIAAAMPVMELVPFSANGAGAALAAFGLSIIGHDGLLALLAFTFTAGTMAVVGFNVL
jgi:hypothetical protein